MSKKTGIDDALLATKGLQRRAVPVSTVVTSSHSGGGRDCFQLESKLQ